MIENVVIVAATLLLHAGVFLGLAWALERGGAVRSFAAREYLWRSAVVGSLASTVLQLALAPALVPGLQTALEASRSTGGAGEAPIAAAYRSDDAASAPAAVVGSLTTARATRAGSSLPVLSAMDRDSAAARSAPASRAQPGIAGIRSVPGVASQPPVVAAAPDLARNHAAPLAPTAARSTGDTSASGTKASTSSTVLQWLRAGLPWLLGLWALAVAVAWLRLAGAARALTRLLRESAALGRADWQQDCAALATHFALPQPPELRRHAALASPLATAGSIIVVPDWALDLPAPQRRALLAHEVAHLARRDPLWRALLAGWRGLLCPLPLATLAARRLDLLAEWRCDAAAAQATGDGRALAACLAQCLQQHLRPEFPVFAAAMAAPRSPLLQRAEHLLEGVPMSSASLSWRARLLPLAAVLAAVLGLPAFVPAASLAAEGIPAPPAPPAMPAIPAIPAIPAAPGCAAGATCTSIHNQNGDMQISLNDGRRRLSYRSRGEVRFNADDTAVASLGPGAEVSWEEAVDGQTRKVEYSGSGAAPTLRYWRDGKEQPLDADGKAWIARIVPQLLREAAIDVEGRVARLVARGGNEAVLGEVDLIRSDYARGRYLGELLRTRTLAAAELDRALQQTRKIGSDYEKRQVLAAALASQQLAKPQWQIVLAAAADIGSDYERAELLVDSAARVAGDAELRRDWLKAGSGIGSDYERRRSLEALLAATRSDAALVEILDAGSGIGSDFELRSLLSGVAHRAADVNAIAPRYAEAAKRIGSDFERREALLALLRSGELKRDGALAVLDAADGIGSDFECREVLVEVARRLHDDAAVRARLLQRAEHLSDFERRQVEDAAGVVRG